LRFEKQQANAQAIVAALKQLSGIKEVIYPGKGAMVSLRVVDESKVGTFLEAFELVTFAESLGGVETLITYPTTQTHADIPKELRESYGLTPDLLRVSVGIESADDIIADFARAANVFK
jgi:cystathionine gamma-synthase